jgi:hypothetical protein
MTLLSWLALGYVDLLMWLVRDDFVTFLLSMQSTVLSTRTAQSARVSGDKPEQFEVAGVALNHSENKVTALLAAGVVSEMCKGC